MTPLKEVKLPSGAVLKITLAPFAVSKALYQSLLKELEAVSINSQTEISSLYKDLFCLAFSSPEIEKCLSECFKRCTYNVGNGDLKIDASTFEPKEAREDYQSVCLEVALENTLPFAKSLSAVFQRLLAVVAENFLA